jgi:hypothetical protein
MIKEGFGSQDREQDNQLVGISHGVIYLGDITAFVVIPVLC